MLHRIFFAPLVAAALLLVGCSHARYQPAGPATGEPRLESQAVLAADGYRLPLRAWLPDGEPTALVLGLHGFSDYGNAFTALQRAVVDARGMALYAYDQRGFGATANTGIWPGTETLVADARTVVALLRRRFPGIPLYLVAESMGAAVALEAMAGGGAPQVDGAVLMSPAVWGRTTMPWYQRLALWLGMRIMPGKHLTSEVPRKLGIQPTDDPEVLRRLLEDPLVQKGARIDALQGVSRLMGAAARVTDLSRPVLVLYAPQDSVIPARPVCAWLRRLAGDPAEKMRFVLYPDGYHMLTRYTGSDRVIADIAAWLQNPRGRIPSGKERDLETAVREVCSE